MLLLVGVFFATSSQIEMGMRNFIDEELMVAVSSSKLYVRMRGNPEGDLIVNLHGGPGGYSGIDIKLMGPKLEDQFLIAYLDQRGCGKSPACTDKSLLTFKQYLEDLDFVIDSLRNRYKKDQVNLMGTSWGGMYGFLYLLEGSKKVNAFACIDGKVNSYYQNTFLLNYQSEKISELLNGNISSDKRTELEKIAAELERIKQSPSASFYKDVNWMLHEVSPKLGFNAYFADTSNIISLDDVLQDTALLNLMRYTKDEFMEIGKKAEFVNQAFLDGPEYNDINIEKDLSSINVPTAVIQGEFDYVVGTGHAILIYNALIGLLNDKKELHILPDTGHCPAIESPDVLANILVHFFKEHSS
ncbi:prolyl aminopeptidase [Sunxiuqinia dokdonensis]|uniref:Prolyl aminopeptidase n=1 Tax=Sunxiuqinia dokdonensis TaxID=1409788 RepID=A0A0L8V398_9BACT|nr:prolyl aminopeptidase [Sunxiuqinia dokdonensis]